MRRLITIGVAALALAVPAAGLADNSGDGSGYGTQPGYGNASDCGTYHGAFDAFGKDNNLGIKSDPTDPGADGQATGDANSAKGCQNNFPTAP
jgi:hypothetical protein